MVSFELATPARIAFGKGRIAEVPQEIQALGVARALLVSGVDPARSDALVEALRARGVAAVVRRIAGEPDLDGVRDAAALARSEGCQGVISLGGGSAIDLGKAVAGLVGNGAEDPLEHLEVVGKARPLTRPALPFVAIPTTAGTGAEVTRNAVISAGDTKASLRSPYLLARLAVVDPDLLAGAPLAVLVGSGLDALTQNIEPYLSSRANPLTDALAAEGMRRSARSLRPACLSGLDDARGEDLALASLLGGLCLANSGLGAVHGFAAPAGAMLGAPHGAICAALLTACLTVNLRALRARAPGHPAAGRFADVARWLTGRADAAAEDGIAWVAELCRDLGVRGLAALGLSPAGAPDLVARAKVASSMRGNPIALTDAELAEIVERSS